MAKSQFATKEEYIASISEEQRPHFVRILDAIRQSIDPEYTECLQYNMVTFAVPLSKYPEGYHCAPGTPLPFISLAANKGAIALYHMGIYADKSLHDWFVTEYPKVCKYKLDMGKSCIRFKRYDDIPFPLITELMSKMSANDWISKYEMAFKKNGQ